MKKISYLFVILAVFSFSFIACDDAGLIKPGNLAGNVSFVQKTKLPTLDPANDGLYNLWIIIADTLGSPRLSHLGRFNVLANGTIVDVSNNPFKFTVNPNDTIDLERAIYAIVSIDMGVVNQPGPTRILAGPFSVTSDSVYTRMTVSDTLAMGSAIAAALVPNAVLYIVNAPTAQPWNCFKGIWFCKENGELSWPSGSALTPGRGWRYQGYLRNKFTNEIYPMGTFYNPDGQDSDGAGACSDTFGVAYSKPGQDWVKIGCSSLNNILDGNHEVFATVEPEFRATGIAPFVMKLYHQNFIVTSVGCNRQDNMFTRRENFPDVYLGITK
jgi:hypothetical protein